MLTNEELAGDQAMENGFYFAAELHYRRARAAIIKSRKDRKRLENKLCGAIDCQLVREGK